MATRARGAAVARHQSIAVVGSINLDLVVPVPHHARPGETVLGGDHLSTPGGKGANQAVAAARLGRSVAMVGRVGNDDTGRMLRGVLASERVDVSHTRVTATAPSGIAMISVDPGGENAIVVSPGANARLAPADIDAAGDVIQDADVLLCQLEVPLESVTAAARCARGTVILNPAPARRLPPELLESVDVLVPNRGELATLADAPEPANRDEAAELAGRISGPPLVVVTLGADGALAVDARGVGSAGPEHSGVGSGGPQEIGVGSAGPEHSVAATHVAGLDIEAVDTTGAGDSFCGALADAMVRGASISDAVRWAVAAGALATTRKGAQEAMPRAAEVESMLR